MRPNFRGTLSARGVGSGTERRRVNAIRALARHAGMVAYIRALGSATEIVVSVIVVSAQPRSSVDTGIGSALPLEVAVDLIDR